MVFTGNHGFSRSRSTLVCPRVYNGGCVYIYIHIYIYIRSIDIIYIERETKRKREREVDRLDWSRIVLIWIDLIWINV